MKPFAVVWDNDCGYGVDYFETQAEQMAFVAECSRTGTTATPVAAAAVAK
ncbi:hypothetical protein NX905_21405 [Burkholderia thailandensis]|nr:hypothetical protein [Burkholderia thailandensis]MCS6496805.1 hypothetical protein [Burkholderia thailandensis]